MLQKGGIQNRFFTLNGLASSLLFYSLLLSDLAISSEI